MGWIYRHKETIFLVVLMLAFALVFFLGYSDFKAGRPIIRIGIDADIINMTAMAFSILAILRVLVLLKSIRAKNIVQDTD